MTSTPWGGTVVYVPSTGSTMDDARDLEARGAPDGSVVWAGFQTAGRGRHLGREWKGNPGESLLFTVYWNPCRFRVPGFAPSLTVGLGVCLWLESLGLSFDLPIRLKWPNDVYLADAKLAGILVRQSWGAGAGSIHAGIGVNLAAPADGGFRSPASSVAQGGVRVSPDQALDSLLPFLAQALEAPDPRDACEQRLWRRGQEMSLSLPGMEKTEPGIVRGLDPQGRLWWEGPRGLEAVSSGE